jgi:predicted nucleic acid-binding protein
MSRTTQTLGFSVPPAVAREVEELAKQERGTGSELLRWSGADPDDNRVLECAVEGDADLIVSGDRHLVRLQSFQGIGIVRPAGFTRIGTF